MRRTSKSESNRKKSQDKNSIYETDDIQEQELEKEQAIKQTADETNSNNTNSNTNNSSDQELSVHSSADLSRRAQMPSLTNLDTSQSKSLDSIDAKPISKKKSSKFTERIKVLV